MRKNALINGYTIIVFMLFMIMVIAFCVPLQIHADTTDNFHVKISYDVEEKNDEDTNKIRVFYWKPTANGYEYTGSFKDLTSIAKYKGSYVKEADLPGPPESIELYIHGSATHPVKCYMTNVEVTVDSDNIVPGSDKYYKRTLWEGKLGCSVATVGSNTIYNRLYFNNPNGGSFPYFQGWKDPDLGINAVFGDDKVEKTTSYDKGGCRNPEPAGVAGFDITNLSEVNVPNDNNPRYYDLELDEGIVYDHFGVAWPDQSAQISLSVSPTDKKLEVSKNDSNVWSLKVDPSSNAADDYDLTVTESKSNNTCSKTIKVHTFDYNYTFKDENGNTIDTKSVNYGDTVTAPEDDSKVYVWLCDDYPDWKNTKTGPGNRIVHRVALNGPGTKENPALISTTNDWESLRILTENGCTKGKHFKLVNNITITSTIGTEQNYFEGDFDGDKKTLTLNYKNDNNQDRTAPFAYIKHLTIENLIVDGSIKGSANRAAGIVGEVRETCYIKNCVVSATIEGKEYVGGFSIGSGAGGNIDVLNIEECTFNGQINGSKNCGGFVSHGSPYLELRNCVVNAKEGSAIESGGTFVCGSFKKIIDCYYNFALGTPQGLSFDRSGLTEETIANYQNQITSAKKLTVGNFKVKAKKNRQAKVTWKKNNKADGYQICYSTSKKFKKSVKSINIDKSNAKKILKKLKSGKKLYVKIRTYKNIKNPASGKKTTVYGEWSKVKSIKAK